MEQERYLPFSTPEKTQSNAWRTARILAGRDRATRALEEQPTLILPDKRFAAVADGIASPAPVEQRVIAINVESETLYAIPELRYLTGLASTDDVQEFTARELRDEFRQYLIRAKTNDALLSRAHTFKKQVEQLLGEIFE